MTTLSLNTSVQSIIDELGSIDREIARLKAQRDDMAAIVKLTGSGRYFGQYFEGLVFESKGRTVTNWKAVAEHFSPSRQLIVAHTSTGEPSLSLKVEALKVTA
jgi:hypothetical protein